jgi:triacylglycerol lipase
MDKIMNPILFIHGFAGSDEHYKPIKKFLKEKGIDNFYEFRYNNKFGLNSLKFAAQELSEYADKYIKEDHIHIIALSQGGIVALTYLKYFGNGKINVDKLFTLCTPHRGSLLAHLFNWAGFVDLRPKSKLLLELEKFIKEEKMEIYSVYTPFDCMVFPGWNARAKRGKRKIVFSPTHPMALCCPAALKFIYKNLK